jgi:hypothetical protein
MRRDSRIFQYPFVGFARASGAWVVERTIESLARPMYRAGTIELPGSVLF